MSNFKSKQLKYIADFDAYAKEKFDSLSGAESTVLDAMKYSFFAGGKRIRPLLCFASAETVGLEIDRALPFAFAIECIHTYSLIHDDLPAMDNDDYRRNKLTNHKVYGEAIAILAGDALLNFALSVCLEECVKNPSESTCKCAKLISDYAGVLGMISGQAKDIISENNAIKDAETLDFIEKNKTGKLICAPLLCPYILKGESTESINKIGELLGRQFQIVDDILDVESTLEIMGKTVGKDKESGKLTYVSLFGLEKAKERSFKIYSECAFLINKLPKSEFLAGICDILYNRIS